MPAPSALGVGWTGSWDPICCLTVALVWKGTGGSVCGIVTQLHFGGGTVLGFCSGLFWRNDPNRSMPHPHPEQRELPAPDRSAASSGSPTQRCGVGWKLVWRSWWDLCCDDLKLQPTFRTNPYFPFLGRDSGVGRRPLFNPQEKGSSGQCTGGRCSTLLPFSHNRQERKFEKLFSLYFAKDFVPRVTSTVAYFPLQELRQRINQALL